MSVEKSVKFDLSSTSPEKTISTGDFNGDGIQDSVIKQTVRVINLETTDLGESESGNFYNEACQRFGVGQLIEGAEFNRYSLRFGKAEGKDFESREYFLPTGQNTDSPIEGLISDKIAIEALRDDEDYSLNKEETKRLFGLFNLIKGIEAGDTKDKKIKLNDYLDFLKELYTSPKADTLKRIIDDTKLFTKLFNFSETNKDLSRGVLRCAALIAKNQIKDISDEIMESNIIIRIKESFDRFLKHREVLYKLSKRGPSNEKGEPFFHWAWSSKINEMISEGEFWTISNDIQIPFSEIGDFYNGGSFEYLEILEAIGTSNDGALITELANSGTLNAMFRFGTTPSPINGFVTLAKSTFKALVNIINAHPYFYQPPMLEEDEYTGLNIYEFAEENLGDDPPFKELTDPKKWPYYKAACKRLIQK